MAYVGVEVLAICKLCRAMKRKLITAWNWREAVEYVEELCGDANSREYTDENGTEWEIAIIEK